jgi:hypothetical protein
MLWSWARGGGGGGGGSKVKFDTQGVLELVGLLLEGVKNW